MLIVGELPQTWLVMNPHVNNRLVLVEAKWETTPGTPPNHQTKPPIERKLNSSFRHGGAKPKNQLEEAEACVLFSKLSIAIPRMP